MTTIIPAQCRACIHVRANSSKCEAYPAGIPQDISMEGSPHNVLRGDETNKVVFTRDETKPDEYDAWRRFRRALIRLR